MTTETETTMAATAAVDYELRGSAAWITLSRPERMNAIDFDTLTGIGAALDRATPAPSC